MDDSESNFSLGPADGYADGEEPIVFHHRDGEFRKYEKKIYSDLATGKTAPKKGIFRVLVSTKMNRAIFFTMIITFAVVLCVSLFGRKSNEGSVSGVSCSLSSFSFGDEVYVSIEMHRLGTREYRDGVGPKTVEFDVTSVDSDGDDVSTQNVVFDFKDSGEVEVCRLVFPNYSVEKIRASASCDGVERELVCNVVAK